MKSKETVLHNLADIVRDCPVDGGYRPHALGIIHNSGTPTPEVLLDVLQLTNDFSTHCRDYDDSQYFDTAADEIQEIILQLITQGLKKNDT